MPEIKPSAVLQGQGPVSQTDKHPDTSNSAETSAAITEATKPDSQELVSPRFAALARQQKAFRQQQKAFEEQRKAFETEKSARQAEIEQAMSWKTRLTQDPLSVIQEAGLSYDQLTNAILNQPSPQDLQFQKLQQELQALKASQEQSLTKIEQAQKQQYEEAKNQIRNDVSSLVDADESFETIKAMNAQEAVVELIEQIYNQEGNLLSIEEAAKEIEEHLVEEAMKLAQLKKIKSKILPPQPQVLEGTQEAAPQQQPQKPLMNTLSNRMVQSPAKPMTSRERRERAIAAFMGKLT
jgi:hypothetical protein